MAARIPCNRGIALGALLFVLAIIAIIAAVIAASSGGLTAPMSQEKARIEAQKIIDFGNRVEQSMVAAQTRYDIPDYGWDNDTFGIGGYNSCTSTHCVVFTGLPGAGPDSIPNLLLDPADIISTSKSSSYLSAGGLALAYIKGVGNINNGQIVLIIVGLDLNICRQINKILGFSNLLPAEPGFQWTTYYHGVNDKQIPPMASSTAIGTNASELIGATAFCVTDEFYGGNEADFIKVVQMR